jgi:hypothetical protein
LEPFEGNTSLPLAFPFCLYNIQHCHVLFYPLSLIINSIEVIANCGILAYLGREFEEMGEARLTKCRKCGKPLGYVTVLGKGLLSWHPQDVKIVAICVECFVGTKGEKQL